jgi:trehalose/maltose hydrolase-like predicted phosphorylase
MVPESPEWPPELCRKFRLLVFEWFGTAVEDRHRCATELAATMEGLLRSGMLLAVVADAPLGLLFEKCLGLVAPEARRGLFVFSSRGSEVWSFEPWGTPRLEETHGAAGVTGCRWLARHVMAERGIGPEEVAVFCGEGRLRFAGLEGSVGCSVCAALPTPGDEALRIGGGPERFRSFLEYQRRLWEQAEDGGEPAFVPVADRSWLVEQEGFDPSRAREMESVFALGNGYVGIRGSSALPIPISQADLYLAGIYDRKAELLPYSEAELLSAGDRGDCFSEIVPLPSPFRYRVRCGGRELVPGAPDLLSHERVLDLKQGFVSERYDFGLAAGGRLTIHAAFACSLADPHLILHELRIQAEERGADVEVEIAPEVSDFALRHPHLRPQPATLAGIRCYQTRASSLSVALGTHSMRRGGGHLEPGQWLAVRSRSAVYSSRDAADPAHAARGLLAGRTWAGFERELAEHTRAWATFWQKADLRLVGQTGQTQAARFGLLHLRCAAPALPYTSVGARGMTGRSYEGHIFWDAEIFLFPFYLYALPEAARNVLRYRYRTLDGARKRARDAGLRGASYAWESTVDGSDVTPREITVLQARRKVPVFTGSQQIHVTADVAYAVQLYWEATGDESLMKELGVEILVETARFWASRVTPKGDRYHILGVVGPDEYHHAVDDNAYTNWMARFNLRVALRAWEWLGHKDPGTREALARRLGLEAGEVARLRQVAERLFVPEPNAEGIVEQFAGFFALDAVQLGNGERFRAPVERLLHWERVNCSRIVKQADVLMIPFLFPDAWPREIVEKNFRYYAPITDHGSSLSPGVHAAVAADLGLEAEADRYLEECLCLDLDNLMHNTALGIHVGNIGASWQAIVLHYLGARWREGRLRRGELHPPLLPRGVREILVNLEGAATVRFVALGGQPERGAA